MRRYRLLGILVVLSMLFTGCNKTSQDTDLDLPGFCQLEGGRLYVKQGKLKMEILPKVGGRISSLTLDGHHMLAPIKDINKITDWGTVLWSSPQEEWMWPPVDVLDSKAYNVSVKGERLVLTSSIDPKTGYQFSKIFMLAGENRIAITYRIFNHSAREKNVAALEVTRLPPSGSIFYPVGDLKAESGIFYPLNVTYLNELVWFDYDAKKIRTDHHKHMNDGKEGWVAYVDKGHLLVKEFVDNPPSAIAKGEREIEIFAHVDHSFIEMKQQSAESTLGPGEHLEWTVIWHVKKLPERLGSRPEPHAIAQYVRELL